MRSIKTLYWFSITAFMLTAAGCTDSDNQDEVPTPSVQDNDIQCPSYAPVNCNNQCINPDTDIQFCGANADCSSFTAKQVKHAYRDAAEATKRMKPAKQRDLSNVTAHALIR